MNEPAVFDTIMAEHAMNEIMTLAEIEARYQSEWILVSDVEFDDVSRLVRGKVVFHSKSRDEIDQRDMQLRLPDAAILYSGRIPDDTAVVL